MILNNIKVGDKVRFTDEFGVVSDVGDFTYTVQWKDGKSTELKHDPYNDIELVDIAQSLSEYISAVDKKYEHTDVKNHCNETKEHADSDNVHYSTHYDNVNKPKHYMLWPEYSIEVRDLMKLLAEQLDEKNYSGLLISDYIQAMQYMLRWHNKNGVEDIKKSVWYLNKMLEQLGDVE